ncbi:MAG: LemA family protein [Chthoniobacterales bacterium]|nr:LemA family protein [Chthoniobacterales bacterium]
MTPLLAIFGIILLLLLLLALWAISEYNGLITLKNRFQNAFSQIDVQLKRRYDLIPNLVESARAYLSHERSTLEAVIQARNAASSATSKAAANPGDATAMASLLSAEAGLANALTRFFAVAEAYPDLKANQTISNLMEELTSTENKISFARQAYNDAVMSYNTKRELFPTNFIASIFQFQPAALFEIQNDKEREAPQVKF